MAFRRGFHRGLFSALFFLSLSCTPSPAKEIFFALTPTGDFSRTADIASLSRTEFAAWPRQARVTDMLSFRGRLFLAVNGKGLAEVKAAPDSVSIVPHYSNEYFADRTVTRLFPSAAGIYCHVYVDRAFLTVDTGANIVGAEETGSTVAGSADASPMPAAPSGLVRATLEERGLKFDPVLSAFPAAGAPWEAVVVRPLDAATFAVEWKLSSQNRTRFRYAAFDLESGTELERDRAWFYRSAAIEPLEEVEDDPPLAALASSLARELRSETPDCLILFTLYDSARGRERRLIFSASGDRQRAAAVYHAVRLEREDGEIVSLLPDGRYVRAPSADEKKWRRGRLPSLPPAGRYTGLARTDAWLCASWEEVDFFRVGRAGLVLVQADDR